MSFNKSLQLSALWKRRRKSPTSKMRLATIQTSFQIATLLLQSPAPVQVLQSARKTPVELLWRAPLSPWPQLSPLRLFLQPMSLAESHLLRRQLRGSIFPFLPQLRPSSLSRTEHENGLLALCFLVLYQGSQECTQWAYWHPYRSVCSECAIAWAMNTAIQVYLHDFCLVTPSEGSGALHREETCGRRLPACIVYRTIHLTCDIRSVSLIACSWSVVLRPATSRRLLSLVRTVCFHRAVYKWPAQFWKFWSSNFCQKTKLQFFWESLYPFAHSATRWQS